jgi:succinate dehydrogenase / fumarate reductase iron-sulfur subunit
VEVKLKVRRFDPSREGEAYYQRYVIDAPQSATVLDSLLMVREQVDGSLAFRCACRSAICGSCAMRINGASRLACKTKVIDVAPDGREITLEPLANLPVIKDLVAEMTPFYEKMRAVLPWLVVDPEMPEPEREYLMEPKRALWLGHLVSCIQCAACYSACPIVAIDDSYLGPAALTKACRYCQDTRDEGKEQRLARVASEEGLWRCHTVFSCSEQCPKGVNPTEAIQQLKKMVILRRLGLDRSQSRRK